MAQREFECHSLNAHLGGLMAVLCMLVCGGVVWCGVAWLFALHPIKDAVAQISRLSP
jgi:hypothetical protein